MSIGRPPTTLFLLMCSDEQTKANLFEFLLSLEFNNLVLFQSNLSLEQGSEFRDMSQWKYHVRTKLVFGKAEISEEKLHSLATEKNMISFFVFNSDGRWIIIYIFAWIHQI